MCRRSVLKSMNVAVFGLHVFEVTLSTFTFPDRGQLDKYEVVQVTLALMNRLNPSFRLAKCSKFVEV